MTPLDFAELWALDENIKICSKKLAEEAYAARPGPTAHRLWELVDMANALQSRLREWLNDHDPEGGA